MRVGRKGQKNNGGFLGIHTDMERMHFTKVDATRYKQESSFAEKKKQGGEERISLSKGEGEGFQGLNKAGGKGV